MVLKLRKFHDENDNEQKQNGDSYTDSIMAQEETEVGHFCWDNSNDDKIELMNGVEKEEGKENGTKRRQQARERL